MIPGQPASARAQRRGRRGAHGELRLRLERVEGCRVGREGCCCSAAVRAWLSELGGAANEGWGPRGPCHGWCLAPHPSARRRPPGPPRRRRRRATARGGRRRPASWAAPARPGRACDANPTAGRRRAGPACPSHLRLICFELLRCCCLLMNLMCWWEAVRARLWACPQRPGPQRLPTAAAAGPKRWPRRLGTPKCCGTPPCRGGRPCARPPPSPGLCFVAPFKSWPGLRLYWRSRALAELFVILIR
jgi:hypothetical protein